MLVKINKLDERAVIPFKKHSSDFCYDVVAVSEEEIAPNVWRYGLGFALQIERGNETLGKNNVQRFYNESGTSEYESFQAIVIDMKESPVNLSIDFRPRSSIFKTGMSLVNATGTVDEDYTGDVKLTFYHLFQNMPRYKVGDRIAQMKIGLTLPIEFKEVESLDDTDRGSNGFGSTGLK